MPLELKKKRLNLAVGTAHQLSGGLVTLLQFSGDYYCTHVRSAQYQESG